MIYRTFFMFMSYISVLPCVHLQSTSEEQCIISKPSVIRFTLNTRKNVTGQWVTQVHLNNENNIILNEDSGPLEVDVLQSTTICEGHEGLEIVATLTCPTHRPGQGYELFPGVGYYKFHTDPKTWQLARQECINEGAHLVVINSEQEANVLRQLYAEHPTIEGASNQDYVFIGFHDRYIEGQFLTIFGTLLNNTGYTQWSHPVQPDNAGGGGPGKPGEDCGSIHRNGGLNDITCGSKLGFICEHEI